MNDSNKPIIPAFYINVTEKCNMKCEYCPTYGENWESTDGLLEIRSVLEAIRIAHKNGIESFRISGGEPMIFPDRVFAILSELNKLGISDIILNTNGFNSYKYTMELAQYKVRKIKISLDTLNRQKFKEITNLDKLNDVIKSILSIKKAGLPLELNMVVFKKNSEDFWEILDFCIEHDISIKLLDLVYYDILVRNNETPINYWNREYFRFENYLPELERRFGKPKLVRLSNDRGIPMFEYNIGDTAILCLKDGTLGSTYADVCRTCEHFPCQEGLFHMSLSAEGNITPCRLRRDLTLNIKNQTNTTIEKEFDSTIKAYQNPFFIKNTVDFPI